MMSKFRMSLTWRDTLMHAVESYGFIINQRGWISGKEFADAIKEVYDCKTNELNKFLVSEIEKRIEKICVVDSRADYHVFSPQTNDYTILKK